MRDYLLGDRAELTDLMAWNTDSTRLPDGMHGPDVTFVLTSGGYNAGIISEPGPPTATTPPHPEHSRPEPEAARGASVKG